MYDPTPRGAQHEPSHGRPHEAAQAIYDPTPHGAQHEPSHGSFTSHADAPAVRPMHEAAHHDPVQPFPLHAEAPVEPMRPLPAHRHVEPAAPTHAPEPRQAPEVTDAPHARRAPPQSPPPAPAQFAYTLPADSGLELVETSHAVAASPVMDDDAQAPRPRRVRPPRADRHDEPLEIIETRKETPPAP
jgi:hypothetical protein